MHTDVGPTVWAAWLAADECGWDSRLTKWKRCWWLRCMCVRVWTALCQQLLWTLCWHQWCLLCSPGGISATRQRWALGRRHRARQAPRWCDWREQRGAYAQWTGDGSTPALIDDTVNYLIALLWQVIIIILHVTRFNCDREKIIKKQLHTAIKCPGDDLIFHVVAQQLQRSPAERCSTYHFTCVVETLALQIYQALFCKKAIIKLPLNQSSHACDLYSISAVRLTIGLSLTFTQMINHCAVIQSKLACQLFSLPWLSPYLPNTSSFGWVKCHIIVLGWLLGFCIILSSPVSSALLRISGERVS